MNSIMHTRSEYKMHSGVISSEQSPRKTNCDLKCKLTDNENVFVYTRKACRVLQWPVVV